MQNSTDNPIFTADAKQSPLRYHKQNLASMPRCYLRTQRRVMFTAKMPLGSRYIVMAFILCMEWLIDSFKLQRAKKGEMQPISHACPPSPMGSQDLFRSRPSQCRRRTITESHSATNRSPPNGAVATLLVGINQPFPDQLPVSPYRVLSDITPDGG